MADLFVRFGAGAVGAIEPTTIPAMELARRWREEILKLDREILSDSERANLDKPLDEQPSEE
jgi:hypothetical protein